MTFRALTTRDRGYDVLVSGLSADQARSLAATLSTAAVESETDPGHRDLRVPRRRNRVFRAGYAEKVIGEWLSADKRRHASITLIDRRTQGR